MPSRFRLFGTPWTVAAEGLSRSFSGGSRKPWVPWTCAGDLREILRVPLRSQGYCGFSQPAPIQLPLGYPGPCRHSAGSALATPHPWSPLSLRSPAQVQGTQGFLLRPKKDLESPSAHLDTCSKKEKKKKKQKKHQKLSKLWGGEKNPKVAREDCRREMKVEEGRFLV